MSKVLFYSKFDKINWTWDTNNNSEDYVLDQVEAVNRQLKAYAATKILLFIGADKFVLLASERNQIDRDNAGRTFSLRQFVFNEREEFINSSLGELLSTYKTDKNDEVKNDNDYLEVIFTLIANSIAAKEKLCIINKSIDRFSRISKEELTDLNFSSFPCSKSFIDALSLFPISLISRFSFCFNYENDFFDVKYSKLTNIDLVYCGTKTIVEDSYDLNLGTSIDTKSLKDQGYSIVYLDEVNQNDYGNLPSLFDVLKNQREQATKLNTVYDIWGRNTNIEDKYKHFNVYVQLFAIFTENDKIRVDDSFAKEIIESDFFDKNIREKAFDRISVNLYKDVSFEGVTNVLSYAKKCGLEHKLEANFNSVFVIGKKDLITLISHPNFNSFKPNIKDVLIKKLEGFDFEWNDITDEKIRNSNIWQHVKPEKLNNIWQKLGDFNNVNIKDSPALDFLYEKHENKRALKILLTKKLLSNEFKEWEPYCNEVFKAKNVSDVDFGNDIQIKSIEDFTDWYWKLSYCNSIFSDKTKKDISQQLGKYIDSFRNNIESLKGFKDINKILSINNGYDSDAFKKMVWRKYSEIAAYYIQSSTKEEEFSLFHSSINSKNYSEFAVNIQNVVDKIKEWDNINLLRYWKTIRVCYPKYSGEYILQIAFNAKKYDCVPDISWKLMHRELYRILVANYIENEVIDQSNKNDNSDKVKRANYFSDLIYKNSFEGGKKKNKNEGSKKGSSKKSELQIDIIGITLAVVIISLAWLFTHISSKPDSTEPTTIEYPSSSSPKPNSASDIPPKIPSNDIGTQFSDSNIYIDSIIAYENLILKQKFFPDINSREISVTDFVDNNNIAPKYFEVDFPKDDFRNYTLVPIEATADTYWSQICKHFSEEKIEIVLDTFYKKQVGMPPLPCIRGITIKKKKV